MFPSTDAKYKKPCGDQTSRASRKADEPIGSSMEELRSRVAVRFFVKKSRRFDSSLRGSQRHGMERSVRICVKNQPECLLYLGLAPRSEKSRERECKRRQMDDFQFTKPRVYECDHCTRIFFHKVLYRRHMIRHIRRIQWCTRCNRGFVTKAARKRHQLTCRR
ncbi:hypothetical protein KM043_014222 [Ampulex compressa]|nr:hypothetical protein KM043_014222 [Ampulex compressa]